MPSRMFLTSWTFSGMSSIFLKSNQNQWAYLTRNFSAHRLCMIKSRRSICGPWWKISPRVHRHQDCRKPLQLWADPGASWELDGLLYWWINLKELLQGPEFPKYFKFFPSVVKIKHFHGKTWKQWSGLLPVAETTYSCRIVRTKRS